MRLEDLHQGTFPLVVCVLLAVLYGCSSRPQDVASADAAGSRDAGLPPGPLVGPDEPACCTACMVAGQPCQVNGCFGGFLCNADMCRCAAPLVDASIALDSGAPDAGAGDAGPADAGVGPVASLRIVEINPAGRPELIELVAVVGGSIRGIRLNELTNSGLSFGFPSGYTIATNDVIVLHLDAGCSDLPTDRASCGSVAPFTSSAWDLSLVGSLTYSGKVFELLAPDGSPMDGVPFVESHGAEPATLVAAVQRLQADRVWAATPACIDDPSTGLAADRYCRNVSVLWDGLLTDNSNSVQRIAGGSALAVPGDASQWSAALPATWGTY